MATGLLGASRELLVGTRIRSITDTRVIRVHPMLQGLTKLPPHTLPTASSRSHALVPSSHPISPTLSVLSDRKRSKAPLNLRSSGLPVMDLMSVRVCKPGELKTVGSTSSHTHTHLTHPFLVPLCSPQERERERPMLCHMCWRRIGEHAKSNSRVCRMASNPPCSLVFPTPPTAG